jgi:hypothetical protein
MHSVKYTSRATCMQLTYILTALRIFNMNMETFTQLTTRTFPAVVRLKYQDAHMLCCKPLLLKTWVLNLAIGAQQASTLIFGLIRSLQLRGKMQCLKKYIHALIYKKFSTKFIAVLYLVYRERRLCDTCWIEQVFEMFAVNIQALWFRRTSERWMSAEAVMWRLHTKLTCFETLCLGTGVWIIFGLTTSWNN